MVVLQPIEGHPDPNIADTQLYVIAEIFSMWTIAYDISDTLTFNWVGYGEFTTRSISATS